MSDDYFPLYLITEICIKQYIQHFLEVSGSDPAFSFIDKIVASLCAFLAPNSKVFEPHSIVVTGRYIDN